MTPAKTTLEHFPLKFAFLCQDCNCVGNSSIQCPACASSALLSLSAVLDREPMEGSLHAASVHESYSAALAA